MMGKARVYPCRHRVIQAGFQPGMVFDALKQRFLSAPETPVALRQTVRTARTPTVFLFKQLEQFPLGIHVIGIALFLKFSQGRVSGMLLCHLRGQRTHPQQPSRGTLAKSFRLDDNLLGNPPKQCPP